MKTFKEFINEGLRNKMVGVPMEDVLDKFLKYDVDDDIEELLDNLFNIQDGETVQYIFDNIPGLYDVEEAVYELITYHLDNSDNDFLLRLFNENTKLYDNEKLASSILFNGFRYNDVDLIINVLDRFPKLSSDFRSTIRICFPDIKSPEKIKKLLNYRDIKNILNNTQLYIIEKYLLGKHKNELKDFEKEILEILENLEYIKKGDILIGKLDNKPYLNYNFSTKKLYYHMDRLGLPLIKDKTNPSFSGYIHDLGVRYMNIIVGGLTSEYLNIEYNEIIDSRNDTMHFITEGIKDKLLPRKTDEIKNLLNKLFIGLKMEYDDTNISDFTDLDISDLYLIFDWDEHYEIFDKYFISLVKNSNSIDVERNGMSYNYYPVERLIYCYDNTLTYSWYFESIHIKDLMEYMIEEKSNESYNLLENKKEEKLKQQRKEEKLYLSQSERKRLNDLQKKSLIKKRKEKGSYNDEDFTNLHLF